jgi:tripartite-type tricarboxylate transporter receptor subunit TctC
VRANPGKINYGIINQLSKALAEICREPDIVKTMPEVGVDNLGTTPEEFAAVITADLPIARAAVEAAGLLKK